MIVATCAEENCIYIYAGIRWNYILINCTLYMHERSSGRGNTYIYIYIRIYIYIYNMIEAP